MNNLKRNINDDNVLYTQVYLLNVNPVLYGKAELTLPYKDNDKRPVDREWYPKYISH